MLIEILKKGTKLIIFILQVVSIAKLMEIKKRL